MQQRAIGFEHQVAHRRHHRINRAEQRQIQPPRCHCIKGIGGGPAIFELDDGITQARDDAAKLGNRRADAQDAAVAAGAGEQSIGIVADQHHFVISFAGTQLGLQIGQRHDIVANAAIARKIRQFGQHGGLVTPQGLAPGAQDERAASLFEAGDSLGGERGDLAVDTDDITRQRH